MSGEFVDHFCERLRIDGVTRPSACDTTRDSGAATDTPADSPERRSCQARRRRAPCSSCVRPMLVEFRHWTDSASCRSPECCYRRAGVAFSNHSRQDQDVFALTLLLLRAITMACRGHHDVILENLALRHQLRTLQRRVKRPHLRTRDRMFWVLLATAWRRWRSALVLVQPETVVRWHRTWLRRRWAQRSGRNRAGRPPLDPAVGENLLFPGVRQRIVH